MQRQDLHLVKKEAIGIQIEMAVRGTAVSDWIFNTWELNCQTENKYLLVNAASLRIVYIFGQIA